METPNGATALPTTAKFHVDFNEKFMRKFIYIYFAHHFQSKFKRYFHVTAVSYQFKYTSVIVKFL
jgi:hypothetical protein